MTPLVILHTNDFHGKLEAHRASRLDQLRRDDDALYFDTGDGIKSGNLGIPLHPESYWVHLREAGCDACTLGNRESQPLDLGFQRKIEGANTPIVVANMFRRSGERVFPSHLILSHHGLRIGVLGVMVPMVTAKMKTAFASQYVWTAPIDSAQEVAVSIRTEVDLLIALTHIGLRQDQALAEACPEIDIILGGHSHTVLETPMRVNNSWIAQGGSHGRYVGRYAWADGMLSGGLLPLG